MATRLKSTFSIETVRFWGAHKLRKLSLRRDRRYRGSCNFTGGSNSKKILFEIHLNRSKTVFVALFWCFKIARQTLFGGKSSQVILSRMQSFSCHKNWSTNSKKSDFSQSQVIRRSHANRFEFFDFVRSFRRPVTLWGNGEFVCCRLKFAARQSVQKLSCK